MAALTALKSTPDLTSTRWACSAYGAARRTDAGRQSRLKTVSRTKWAHLPGAADTPFRSSYALGERLHSYRRPIVNSTLQALHHTLRRPRLDRDEFLDKEPVPPLRDGHASPATSGRSSTTSRLKQRPPAPTGCGSSSTDIVLRFSQRSVSPCFCGATAVRFRPGIPGQSPRGSRRVTKHVRTPHTEFATGRGTRHQLRPRRCRFSMVQSILAAAHPPTERGGVRAQVRRFIGQFRHGIDERLSSSPGPDRAQRPGGVQRFLEITKLLFQATRTIAAPTSVQVPSRGDRSRTTLRLAGNWRSLRTPVRPVPV